MGEESHRRPAFRLISLNLQYVSFLVQTEAPEEPYDPRTLYERLKEQRDKKDEEWEESRKLKHLIKGLDNDEVSFLEMVDNTKIQLETQRMKEEVEAIDEYKKAVSHLNSEEQEKRLNDFKKEFFAKNNSKEATNKTIKKSSQSTLMANLVKKRVKSETNEDDDTKRLKTDNKNETNETNVKDSSDVDVIKCIGVLPGLGDYASDSSDSENSSGSEAERATDFSLIVRGKRQCAQEVKTDNSQTQH